MNSNSRALYLEFGQETFRILMGDAGWELALERTPAGKLDLASEEKLVAGLKDFLRQRGFGSKTSAVCGIGARGVSLRRLAMPSARGEWDKMIPLLIEREFPIGPESLAWGWEPINEASSNGPEILIVAVKKEILEEYSKVLTAAGIQPSFTLAAQGRLALVPDRLANLVLLDVGSAQAEIATFSQGLPVSLRPLSIPSLPDGQLDLVPVRDALQSLAGSKPIYLTGQSASARDFGNRLIASLPPSSSCQRIGTPESPGVSAATVGLQKAFESGGRPEPIMLESRAVRRVEKVSTQPAAFKWVALAALLAIGCFSLRFVEPFVQQPRLAKRVAEMRAFHERFPRIDRELSFLLYLKTNQPPYLDPLYIIAQSAPPGMKLENISMNRRGEVSLRAGMQGSQQAMDFRSKLVDSGLFSAVVLEEQTPTPDRQRVNIRMVAQWKPGAEVKLEPAKEEAKPSGKKAATNLTASASTNAPKKSKEQP